MCCILIYWRKKNQVFQPFEQISLRKILSLSTLACSDPTLIYSFLSVFLFLFFHALSVGTELNPNFINAYPGLNSQLTVF